MQLPRLKLQFLSPAAAMQKSGGKGKSKEVTEEKYKKYLKNLKKKLKKQKKKAKKVPPRNFAAEKVQEAAAAKDRGEYYQSPFASSSCGGPGPGL